MANGAPFRFRLNDKFLSIAGCIGGQTTPGLVRLSGYLLSSMNTHRFHE